MYRLQISFSGFLCLLFWGILCPSTHGQEAKNVTVKLRYQSKVDEGKSWFDYQFKNESWNPDETALIVCDFWDYHHCLNAVRRIKEFGPRLNQVVKKTREQGVTIIHAPSDCMEAYAEHPARRRMMEIPQKNLPEDINKWCSQIPSEVGEIYPIDQSDGGEDDDPEEHAQWAEKLKSLGRNPKVPWKEQNKLVAIDADQDFISDRGAEIWSLLKQRKIKNVILTGVHTNMCVLGRPFGLRQMKRLGVNVVLMRDMTDCMYNPKSWPYVSHFAGNEKIIAYIERHICPTIDSSQLIGGSEFVFDSDKRPHLAIMMGEKEYQTARTLPEFASGNLADFRISLIFADSERKNFFHNLRSLSTADILLISVRRRLLSESQMNLVRNYEKTAKPIIGIRTASHAFSVRNGKPSKGQKEWKSFDADVFGGNYTNHYGNDLKSMVSFTPIAETHPITRLNKEQKKGAADGQLKTFGQSGSLYKTSPLADGTQVLLNGTVLGRPAEPVAWTFKRANGGRSFYTSLGHPGDFQNPEFRRLIRNSLLWAIDRKPEDHPLPRSKNENAWRIIDGPNLPANKKLLVFRYESENGGDRLDRLNIRIAYRKVVRLTGKKELAKQLVIQSSRATEGVWLDGIALKQINVEGDQKRFVIPDSMRNHNSPMWLVLGAKYYLNNPNQTVGKVSIGTEKEMRPLTGKWEWRSVENSFSAAARFILPAQFGGRPQVYCEFRRPAN